MPFVLDASVTVAWSFQDQATPYSNRVLSMLLQESALVPSIWALEVTKAFLSGERRGRLRAADVMRIAALLQALPIQVVDTSIEHVMVRVVPVAQGNALTTYDASYLELAMREGLPLATQDECLRVAATEVGVSLV